MSKYLCQMKSYIQPFEKVLAVKEMENFATRITPISNSKDNGTYEIFTLYKPENLVRELSYWEKINKYPTLQVLRESSSYFVRNGVDLKKLAQMFPISKENTLPNRRVLRYGSHGIHEYRGKFFPQLVRALVNISGTPEDGLVADPMCGSGTTIAETALAGRTGIGLDINPLSILLSEAKVGINQISPESLETEYKRIRRHLLDVPTNVSELETLPYFSQLHESDKKYLKLWFSHQVLCDLDVIMQTIATVKHEVIRKYFTISFSNTLRKVSYQKLADLRVRRDMKVDEDLLPIKEFLDELGKSIRLVIAFLHQNSGEVFGSYEIKKGNATEIQSVWMDYLGKVDTVITSPPYATALPYLDTDRLSLSYLGLLPRNQHRKKNLDMIGNREVNKSYLEGLWKHYLENKKTLPISVTNLLDLIDNLNRNADVGFRRKNLSALLAKYFFDMKKVFIGMLELLKNEGYAFIVVGNNHTKAGNNKEHIDIDTASLLSDLAISIGFIMEESIPMEMLVSRDIFRNNAIASEHILVLRKS